MKVNDRVLRQEERAIFSLRSLYGRYGYALYKMSKFEEYEFYIRNKDFLLSDAIITFNDPGGKLLALKPDVTLSIIRQTRDLPGRVHKVYYNENVYRVSKGTGSYKEIMQVGLECIGDIDRYHTCEVLMLAAKSLRTIAPEGVLDVSHQGIITALLDACNVAADIQQALLTCIGEKNAHEAARLCADNGIAPALTQALRTLITTYGAPDAVLPVLRKALAGLVDEAPLCELEQVMEAFADTPLAGMLRLDFSVTGNRKYYNGLVFKGFVPGIPESVLSGGRYDPLLKGMGRTAGALGFAVYLDLLEMLDTHTEPYDVDTVLLYDDSTTPAALCKAVQTLSADGTTVVARRHKPEKMTYRRLLTVREGKVIADEADA